MKHYLSRLRLLFQHQICFLFARVQSICIVQEYTVDNANRCIAFLYLNMNMNGMVPIQHDIHVSKRNYCHSYSHVLEILHCNHKNMK